jgi:hypothetical protein
VFNGGAWLEIDGRRSEVHYRELDVVDREIAAAREGRFTIQPLRFHLAGRARRDDTLFTSGNVTSFGSGFGLAA